MEDISDPVTGTIFKSVYDFAITNFKIEINDNGEIIINGYKETISYSLKKDHFTKKEAIENYILGKSFIAFAESSFWTFYNLSKKQ
ncbi:MAG: hypothetical protein ACJA2M_000312 [Polaribacter sp.]|jgi:hypothetical protein